MTAPGTAAELPLTIPAPAPEPLTFPVSWVVEHAAAPIKYRAMSDVARLSESAREVDWLPYSHRPAAKLAVTQNRDGTWNNSILGIPGKHSAGT